MKTQLTTRYSFRPSSLDDATRWLTLLLLALLGSAVFRMERPARDEEPSGYVAIVFEEADLLCTAGTDGFDAAESSR
jgi:hypothetical protein